MNLEQGDADGVEVVPAVSGIGIAHSPSTNGVDASIDVGAYRIQGQIGAGGMGTVWRAVQLGTNRPVALKVMSSDVSLRQISRLRFEREVSLAASLEHPAIARVYDSGVHRGRYYYAMELVEGKNLDRYVVEDCRTLPEVLKLLLQVCDAVQYAHDHGVIHRDLKPSNIVVTPAGTPKLLDFGLAKAMDVLDPPPAGEAPISRLPELSSDGGAVGTPLYMSPEQAAGQRDVDVRTDVYSLGIILKRLLACHSVQTAPELVSIIEACTKHHAADRYASVRHLQADLKAYLAGRPVSAHPARAFYLATKWALRHRLALAVALTFVVVLCAVSIGFTVRLWKERSAALQSAERAATVLYRQQIASAHMEQEHERSGQAQRLLEATEPSRRDWEWHFLNSANQTPLIPLDAPDNLQCATVPPDGSVLVTVSASNLLRVAKAETLAFCWEAPLVAAVSHIIFSADASTLLVAQDNGTVQLFNVSDGSVLLRAHLACHAVAAGRSGRRLFALVEDGHIIVLDRDADEMIMPFGRSAPNRTHLAVSPDELMAITAGNDGCSIIRRGAPVEAAVALPPTHLVATSWIENGRYAVLVTDEVLVYIDPEQPGRPKRDLLRPDHRVVAGAFSATGDRMLLLSENGRASMFSFMSGSVQEAGRLFLPEDISKNIKSLSVLMSGDALIHSEQLYNVAFQKLAHRSHIVNVRPTWGIAVSEKGDKFFICTSDGRLSRYDRGALKPIWSRSAKEQGHIGYHYLACDAAGKFLVAASDHGQVSVFAAHDGAIISTLLDGGADTVVTGLQWDPAGKWLLVSLRDRLVLFSVDQDGKPAGKAASTLEGGQRAVFCGHSGQIAAIAGRPNKQLVRVWASTQDRWVCEDEFEIEQASIACLAWSAQGNLIVGDEAGTIAAWSLADRSLQWKATLLSPSPVLSIAYLTSNRLVAAGRSAVIVDSRDGGLVVTLPQFSHRSYQSLAASADGKVIIAGRSGGFDEWDITGW